MEVEHFSNSSINCYLYAIKELCKFCDKLPDQIGEEDLYSYLVHLKNVKHLSRETIRNHLQGIRFVFRKLYKRIDIIQDMPYPKQTKRLPVILTSKELKLLFNSAHSFKHCMVLKIAYSGGFVGFAKVLFCEAMMCNGIFNHVLFVLYTHVRTNIPKSNIIIRLVIIEIF